MKPDIEIESPHDGYLFRTLRLEPTLQRRGGLVLLQEIFGLDAHIRRDAIRWAQAGFEVLAPSLFDRCERGFTAAHDPVGIQRGMACLQKTPDDQALGDSAACIATLATQGPVFLLGYCYGGRLAWAAAGRLQGIAGAVTYYGNVLATLESEPQCPVLMHFGVKDPHLPVGEIATAMQKRHPAIPVFLYPESGHAFNNEGAAQTHPADASEARRCTLAFFEQQLAARGHP